MGTFEETACSKPECYYISVKVNIFIKVNVFIFPLKITFLPGCHSERTNNEKNIMPRFLKGMH